MRDNMILFTILTMASLFIYLVQFLIFHRAEETIFYMLQDLAFIPVQAAIVTLVLNRFLSILEKRKKMKRIHVVISAFFVEAGTDIMTALAGFNKSADELCKTLNIQALCTKDKQLIRKLKNELKFDMYADSEMLGELVGIMAEKKPYMLGLLENSNLMEHDSFTDMLWAVFHVCDELQSRGDLKNITKADTEHLSNDLLRAFSAIIPEWIDYIIYLHEEYPYLYALEVRKNPFCR